MQKEKKILLSFSLYLLLFIVICLYGITHVSAQVISSSYLDTSVNNTFWLTPVGYRQANSSLVVDSSSAEKYIVIDLCDSLYSSLSITNVSSSSGNVTFYKSYAMNKSCQIDANNTGTIDRLYFTVNTWSDAGNGNYGVIFNSRLNSLVDYNSVVKVLNITTSNTIDISDLTLNNQNEIKNELNNIQGSITDTENNLNNSITNSKNDIIDNQDKNNDKVIENNDKNTDKILEDNKKNFQTCRDSVNLFDKNNILSLNAYFEGNTNIIANNNNRVFYIPADSNTAYTIHQGTSNLSNHLLQVATTDVLPAIDVPVYNFKSINTTNYTYTTNSTAKYLVFRIRLGDYTSGYLDSFQVEKGSSFTQYEPYGKQICTNKLDEANETSKGILGTIKTMLSYLNPFSENFFAYKLVELILNGLKDLIVPKNFDFINDFKDVLEDKLGFIASIPLQLVDYLLSLKDKVFNPMTSFTFPKMTFFGYSFWNEMTIDITQGLSWISSIKYLTDLGCVIIMINTLRKWYENFTGGAEK